MRSEMNQKLRLNKNGETETNPECYNEQFEVLINWKGTLFISEIPYLKKLAKLEG